MEFFRYTRNDSQKYMPKIIDENTILGNPLHEWTIQEYEQFERGSRWYLLMGFIGITSLLYSVLSGNFLFSLVIILFGLIIWLQSHQTPPQLSFVITDLGIVIGKKFHPYSEMESFYIVYRPPEVKTLFLETKSLVEPSLHIPLLDADPVEVRFTLLEYLPENTEKEDEPISDQLARNLRLQ